MCLEDGMDRKMKKSYGVKWYIIGESNHYILRIRQGTAFQRWESPLQDVTLLIKTATTSEVFSKERTLVAIGVSIEVVRHVFAIHHWQTCSITYLLYRLWKATATPSPTSRSWFDPSLTWNGTPSLHLSNVDIGKTRSFPSLVICLISERKETLESIWHEVCFPSQADVRDQKLSNVFLFFQINSRAAGALSFSCHLQQGKRNVKWCREEWNFT